MGYPHVRLARLVRHFDQGSLAMFVIAPGLEIQWQCRRPRNAERLVGEGWTFLPLNREWDAIERDLIIAATGLGAISPEYGCLAPHRWWVAFLKAFLECRDPIRSARKVEHLKPTGDAQASPVAATELRDRERWLDPGYDGGRLDRERRAIGRPDLVGVLDYPSAWMKLELFQIEGRGVAIAHRGRGGWAWVWADYQWRWAPGLANKDGVPMSAHEFHDEFPDADMGDIIRIVSKHASA